MALNRDEPAKAGSPEATPLTQAEFDQGLIRALEHSLAEAQGKRFYFERADPPMGRTKIICETFRCRVAAHQFGSLEEAQQWIERAQTAHGGDDEERLAARRFLWRLRQNVCSCPIFWRGRRRVGEVG